jgi:hypothetical protein
MSYLMGKRGPRPSSLSDLLIWESMWHWIFVGLRGRERTPEEALLRGNILASYREALREARADLAQKEKAASEDTVVWRFHADQLAGDIERQEHSLRHEHELAEPEVWRGLVRARTAEQVRQAYGQSKRWLNPQWRGRTFVQLLFDEAGQFVRAKHDHFYPRASHLSSDRKRVVFFARAMAGLSCGISPSTAVGLLRKLNHGKNCPCVNCNSARWEKVHHAMYIALDKVRKKNRSGKP